MLSREQRIEIKKCFDREVELKEKINWNISEVLSLKADVPTGSITEKARQMNEAIRFGKSLVAKQERELKDLSIPAISRKLGMSKQNVLYYKSIFGYK